MVDQPDLDDLLESYGDLEELMYAVLGIDEGENMNETTDKMIVPKSKRDVRISYVLYKTRMSNRGETALSFDDWINQYVESLESSISKLENTLKTVRSLNSAIQKFIDGDQSK